MEVILFLIVNIFVLGINIPCDNKAGEIDVQANDDFVRISEDEEVDISVLKNDFGLYDGVKSLNIKEGPENGTVNVNANNTITYIPDLSFFGEDDFIYEVCNVDGSCGSATVTVVVDNVNHKPLAVNDTVSYLHGYDLSIPVLGNDTISGDYPFSLDVFQNFTRGDAYFNDENQLIVTFDRDYGGLDSLQYSLCDADGDCCLAWCVVDIRFDGRSDVYVPNGFSPNGDGLNDIFFIPDFRTYTNIRVSVFTEWGQLVYQNEHYQNNWDGIGNTGAQKGKPLKSGTYYYVFNVDGVDKTVTGYVYLSR